MDAPPSRHSTQDTRVDDLRQQLRALGYLDAGVDRFVLGGATSNRRPVAIAALASARIALLAAALLGPAAALGIGTRLPGLVTGTRDAVVVALYLAVLFGVAAGLVSFVASMVVATLPLRGLAPRARLVSRGAGTVVGAACLAYLTLWWGITSTGVSSVSLMWTAFALAIAVAISLLLGHATTITAFAVLVAAHGHPDATGLRRGSARRLTAVAAGIAFVGAAALLILAAPSPQPQATPPNLGVVSPGLRIRLFAIDGFDPSIVEALRAEGRIPTLTRIFSGGTVQIAPEDVRDPARTWTTIATGQPADVHGVEGLETRRVAGLQGSVTAEGGLSRSIRGATDLLRLTRPSTASGAELRAKTFWEVAADAGLRPAVVNWWATWPAMGSGGNAPVVISDRATLRLERGGTLDGEIAPRELYEQLQREWPSIKKEAAAVMTALLPASTDVETTTILRRAAEVDAIQLSLMSRLDIGSLDVVAVYLPGLDIAQHALLQAQATAAPSTLSARLEGLRSYYRYLDALLTEATIPATNELVMVLTEPGRVEATSHGALAIAGQGAAATVTARARAIDVAPTILHALGVPVSRELSGAPILGMFSGEFVRRYPVRTVDSYGRRISPGRLGDGQPLDQEMIERLRSLGYVR